jgi:hypothetical protein
MLAGQVINIIVIDVILMLFTIGDCSKIIVMRNE